MGNKIAIITDNKLSFYIFLLCEKLFALSRMAPDLDSSQKETLYLYL